MLDYFAGPVGYDASGLELDKTLVIRPNGEITYIKERWERAFAGSYEETVKINRTSPTADMIEAARNHNYVCSTPCYYVSGEMIKVLQGHNVFGPSVDALGTVIRDVMRQIVKEKRPVNADSPLWPAIERNRVDVTMSIRMDSDAQVNEWLMHAKNETRRKRGGLLKTGYEQKGLTGVPQVCYGLGSKRWSIVCYNKFAELKIHPPKNEKMYEELLEYVEGLLRIELRLFRLELKPRGTLCEYDNGTKDGLIIWKYFDRIEVGVMKDDVEKGLASLRPHVQMTYLLWKDGHDVSTASGRIKRAAFYKYRREILEATGEDISLPPAKKKASAGTREQFNTDYLKAHEEKEVPGHLQKYLYIPGEHPIWQAH